MAILPAGVGHCAMAGLDFATMEIVRRLRSARMAVLSKSPFFGVLLMNLRMAIDKTTASSYTDGERLSFNPDFLNSLSDSELELVMMHEVLHVALGHPFRVQADYETDLYDLACDIVVNSNILQCTGGDIGRITIGQLGVLPHKAPNGKEGYECTVEEIYADLLEKSGRSMKAGEEGAREPCENNAPEKGDSSDKEGKEEDGEAAAEDGEAQKGERGGDDSKRDGCGKKQGTKKGGGTGDGGAKSGERIPGGKNGGEGDSDPPSLEDLVASVKEKAKRLKERYELPQDNAREGLEEGQKKENAGFDDHSFWQGDDEEKLQSSIWEDRVMWATELVLENPKSSEDDGGGVPLCALRLVKELREPKIDWRALLHNFLQEEIHDYSFSPPDKRMDDSPFFLPDFNEKCDVVKNIWFVIDTSGSIGDDAMAAAYSEIISALDVFDKLEGLLSFTEVHVTEPIPFCSPEELLEIKPVGGGGNDFSEIFRFMQRHMMDNPPTSIVILTDGYDAYPEEEAAMGIPVLWLINNRKVTPPWGKFARFEIEREKT